MSGVCSDFGIPRLYYFAGGPQRARHSRMQGFIATVFGHGKDLNALQMSCRAFVLFFVALVLVRICGMRAFGRKSSFDTVVLVGLGTVLMRAVYGASPAIPIVCASGVLVI